MLTIDGLTIRYGRTRAVDDLSLDVEQGEIVGLIGPNGAGKTSTMEAVAGLVRPAAGRILFEGRDLSSLAPEARVRAGISLVPEGRHVFASLTVAENLALGANWRRDDRVGLDLERELDRFPVLRRYYRTHAGKLSGGEQQQLASARALLARPRLLLLDEPSFGLAPLIIDQVFDTVRQLRDDGVTILLVEQNAMRTIEIADRCLVVRSGRIALTGTRDQLLSDDVTTAYLGV